MLALVQDHAINVGKSRKRAGKKGDMILSMYDKRGLSLEGQRIRFSCPGSPTVIGVTPLRPVALRSHPLE